jgi:predicted chitinase
MADVIGEPFKPYVADQIKTRQKIHGSGTTGNERTPEYITYLNSSTAWIKLASGVRISETRAIEEEFRTNPGLSWDTLAKQYILFGGVARLEGNTLVQRGNATNKNNITDWFDGAYHVTANEDTSNYDFGIVPMPGIVSADVACKNRGSIREANIKVKAYNRDQFDILNILYLRLGYTVLLEWGNSLYYDNDEKFQSMGYTLTEDPNGFFGEKYKTHSQFLPVIEGYRKGKDGNYDGMLGKVKNFTWSYNQDGTYDIDISIISLGDVVESLKTNLTPNFELLQAFQVIQNIDLETGEVDGEDSTNPPTQATEKTNPQNNIISAYLLQQKLYLIGDNPRGWFTNRDYWYNSDITYTIDGENVGIGTWIKPTTELTVDIDIEEYFYYYDSYIERRKELQKLYAPYLTDQNGDGSLKYGLFDSGEDRLATLDYLTLGVTYAATTYILSIEGTIKVDKLKVGTTDETKNICYFNYVEEDDSSVNENGFYMRFGHLLQFLQKYCLPTVTDSNGKETPIFKIDYGMWNSRMLYYPNQISFDPRVCVVNSVLGDHTLFPQLVVWRNEDKKYAWTMNMYVSFNTIQSAMDSNMDEEGNLAIYPFLDSICVELNKALGGINNLEPTLDEDTNTLRIIDSSYSKNKETPNYTLELYGYNNSNENQKGTTVSNFVRGFDLKTEITPEYASMVTIGATAGGYVKGTESTMFSKWNKGLIDRFKEKYNPPKQIKESDPNEPRTLYFDQIYNNGKLGIGYKYIDVDANFANPPDAAQLQNDVIDANIAAATEYYKWLNSKAQEKNKDFASTTLGFIPFNLSVNLNGISGIKIYNELNVSTKFLPKLYPKSLRFIVKGVNHKLQNNDWETNIETVVIPNALEREVQYKELEDLILNDVSTLGKQSGENINTLTPPVTTAGIGDLIRLFTKNGKPQVPESKRNIITKIVNLAKKNGITDKERLTCILAVAGGETQWNPGKSESFIYSLPRAREVFGSRIPKDNKTALTYIPTSKGGSGSQEKLANLVYGKRYLNAADEGWKYRGRGMTQITFKGNYQNVQNNLVSKYFPEKGNIITNPDLVNNEDVSVAILVYGKKYGYFGDYLVPNDKAYLTDPVRIQATQNGSNGKGERRSNAVTKNYTNALNQINNTSWVQELIN